MNALARLAQPIAAYVTPASDMWLVLLSHVRGARPFMIDVSKLPNARNIVRSASAEASVRPLEEASDVALVEAVRAGLRHAPVVLFDRHAPRVERVLYRLLGPRADLADALNETFRRALEHLDDLLEPVGLDRWLVAIAVNVAREEMRSGRRRGWLEYRPVEELPQRAACSDPVEARAAVRSLFEVLQRMPEDEGIVFALRHLEGLTIDALAEVLNVSLSTVKRRILRADARFARLAAREPELAMWVHDDGASFELDAEEQQVTS